MMELRIALFFDIFTEKGGAERAAIILAKHLNADIYTTYVDWNNADKGLKQLNVNEIGLTFKNTKLLTYSEIARRFSKLKLTGYDVYLFMRLYCISAAKNHHPNKWICCSPIRSVYDLHSFIYKRLCIWQKPIFKFWCLVYKKFDKMWIKNFDKINAISKNVANRLKEFYNIDVPVTYLPIELKEFKCKGYKDFYLAPGRLVKEKRFDLIIEAFNEMPDKKLVITGDGPERQALEKMVKNNKNIVFFGSIDYKTLVDLYSTCTATIYMPINEDYGLVPIESMASGKPCIAANEGGPRETIINGKTGFLIKPEKEEIKKYVSSLTLDKAKKMKYDCLKRAKSFDVDTFIKNIKKEIKGMGINDK
jgi:glycosyltransferase involved in cell wall biosynthesis